jgi:putative membrane protein
MDSRRRATLSFLGIAALALAHALWSWPLDRVFVLFAGGATLAFLSEAAVIKRGVLEHHTTPKVAGVPLAVVAVWPAVVYAFLRLSLLAVNGALPAAALAAVLATAWDLLTDPPSVGDLWIYPESAVSSPRFRGVPWWNFAGWLLIVFVTALLPRLVGV